MRNSKRYQRHLSIERLGQRNVLSAIPVLPPSASGEGEDATVEQQGQTVQVIGSDNDDVIRLELGETTHRLTVNGESTNYNAAEVTDFVIRGDAGTDELILQGSALDESVEVTGGGLELSSNQHSVSVSLVEDVAVLDSDGFDRAVLFDTAGTDSLALRSDRATLTDSQGNEFEVQGFDRVMSFATQGGDDTAQFFGTTATDTFIGKEAFSYMVGTGFWNYARGFQRVDVFQETVGDDVAWLIGSSGNDVVDATADEVVLVLESGKTLAAHGFGDTRVDGGAGDDSANLTGEAGSADRLEWDPTSAQLTTVRASETVQTTVEDFETVQAFGGDSTDTAELRGSNEADQLIALPEVAQLTTPTATVMAHAFSSVMAHGGEGLDTAHLEDSRFNDTYVGKPHFAYLTGPGYFNLTTGFDEIDVAATNGGYDISNTHFGATIYTIAGGQVSLPHVENGEGERVQVGQLELTTSPGVRINAFTQDDLNNNRVVYVHSETNDDPFDVDLTLRVNDQFGNETTVDLDFPINKDGAGKRFEVTAAALVGDVSSLSQLEANFFVLDVNQHLIFGTSRSERVFGISRFRATGPGNLDRTPQGVSPNFFGTRVNQNGLILFPTDLIDDLEARDATPVADYDLIDGVLVNVGDAVLNPPQIDF